MCDVCGGPLGELGRLPVSDNISRLPHGEHSDVASELLLPDLSATRAATDKVAREITPNRGSMEELEATLARLWSKGDSPTSYCNKCGNVLPVIRGDRAAARARHGHGRGIDGLATIIRRIPAELLVEIFDVLVNYERISMLIEETKEMDRLGKKHLRQISQVCSHWHSVAATPRLWSSIVVETSAWPNSANASQTLFAILTSTLERGGDHPLSIELSVDHNHTMTGPILELISQHSRRWKKAEFWMHPSSFGSLVGVRGHLPLLEDFAFLDISENDGALAYVHDIFETAPRLTAVSLMCLNSIHPVVSWDQLASFFYCNGPYNRLPFDIIPVLSRWRCDLLLTGPVIPSPFAFQPLESRISALLVQFTDDYHPQHTEALLGAILECLTLPCLTRLRLLFSRNSNAPTPSWTHSPFMKFISRSSLGSTLTSFEVHAMIKEEQLLECLAALPMLQELHLSDVPDQQHSQGNGWSLRLRAEHIITDSFLRQLAWKHNHANLIPQLHLLHLRTLMRFCDDALEDCITSRIDTCRSEKSRFRTKISWMAGYDREVSPDFTARMLQKEHLSFSVGTDDAPPTPSIS
ncbi:hypothetical protein DFH06DRAFT_1371599 [Mycena polygramma]|nr:hypothetical protein DFH06DRAFT_1371599 [Mycena polygramma]